MEMLSVITEKLTSGRRHTQRPVVQCMSDVQKTLDEKQYDWKEVQQFRAIFLFVLLFAVEEGGRANR